LLCQPRNLAILRLDFSTRAPKMDRHPAHSHLVRFGDFEVNLRSGELRRNGLKIKLPDQSFRVLCLLLENPGEVGRRDLRRLRRRPQ